MPQLDNAGFDTVVKQWVVGLADDPAITPLLMVDEEEVCSAAQGFKFMPAHHATLRLLESMQASGMPPGVIGSMEVVLDTLTEICMRAACSDPSSSEDTSSTPALKTPLGVLIQRTSLARRASTSYRLFDRLGGWETLSAAVDGTYGRLCEDSRIGTIEPEHEQAIKTDMLEFMTAAFGAGYSLDSAVQTPQENSGLDLAALGLRPIYYDCMIEHLQFTLDYLGLPHDDVKSAIGFLTSKRAAHQDMTDGQPSASLFGKQLRLSFSGVNSSESHDIPVSGQPNISTRVDASPLTLA